MDIAGEPVFGRSPDIALHKVARTGPGQMPIFYLRGGERKEDGTFSSHQVEHVFEAKDMDAAVWMARSFDTDAVPASVNAFWLTDANGRLVWSLRRDDPR